MEREGCPVQRSRERILGLKGQLGDLEPLNRLLFIYEDIIWGRVKNAPFDSLLTLLQRERGAYKEPRLNLLLEELWEDLEKNRPIYESHVKALYCPSGECAPLKGAPCQIACPGKVDVPTYVALVGRGEYGRALEILWEDIPFPGILGRVCVHPCEEACRRAHVDKPVAICLLKRVAYDKGIESAKGPRNLPPLKVAEKVAIVGSGPAGLSCGYFLRKLGIGSTIFEAMPKAGGLLRYGIPRYRLPEEVLDREIQIIASLGVEIQTNTKFGQDLSLEALRSKGYRAIFLALGAWCSPKLGIENEDHSHVVDCLSFLRDGEKQEMVSGKDVVVIGGGNAAIDCVRTSVRKGARNVVLLYRRTREEMPAHREEIQAALEEGVAFRFLVSPVKIVVEEGRLKGLICIENELGAPDASGRRQPVPIKGSEHLVLADIIIPAIGQEVDRSSLCDVEGLSFKEKGRIFVDPETLMTRVEGIFAGGDLVLGPSSVIEAVEQGKRAAYAIKAYLEKRAMDSMPLLPKRYVKVPGIRRAASESLLRSRLEPHCIEGGERVCSFKEVIEEVGGLEAQKEGERCLRCDVCTGCGRCVSVCREGMQIGALRFSFVKDRPQETDPERAKEACIGCGACAINCPTGAITLEKEGSILSLSLVGMVLASHEAVKCKSCGLDYIAPFQRGFIQNGLPYHQRIALEEDLCPECRRRSRSV